MLGLEMVPLVKIMVRSGDGTIGSDHVRSGDGTIS